MNHFATNLKYLRKKNGLGQTELALMTGKKGGTSVANWELGTAIPPVGVLSDISHIFKVKIDDLMNKDLSDTATSLIEKTSKAMTKLVESRQEVVYTTATDQLAEQRAEQDTPDNVVSFSTPKPDEPEARDIICGRATAAGAPINGDDQDGVAVMERVHVDDIPRGTDEIVTVDGDSMEPDYPRYSQAFLRHQEDIESGEKAIVQVADEGVTFKQIYLDYDNRTITLHSLNDKYPDRVFPCKRVRVIGKVIN